MALARDKTPVLQGDTKYPFQIVNSAVTFAGSLIEGVAPDDATAANRGRIRVFSGAVESIPLGFALAGATGDTTASPIVRGRTALEARIEKTVSVTGVVDREDTFKLVYATDDETFTLTRPTLGIPVGIILRFISGTNCDVRFFSFVELATIQLAGSGQYLWNMGVISPVLSASADLLTGIEAPHHGRINSVFAICLRAPTDADVDIDANLEIGGTNVTGGVIELINTDTVGLKKAGTAITALNIFHEGDLIDVEGVVNTAGTATDVGAYNLYAEVEPLLGH